MSQKTSRTSPGWLTGFGAQVTLGLIVGVILGLVAKNLDAGLAADDASWLTATASWIGSTYVKLLKLMIAPLILTAVITSIANLRQVNNAARLAGQTIVWFAITAFFSVLAGILVALVIKPGLNAGVDPATAAAPGGTGSWLGFINSVIPGNFLGIEASVRGDNIALGFNALQLIVIAMALGIAAIKAGKAAEPFLQFNESLLQVIQVILWWIIRLAPIGTAALIANAVASYGWDAIGSLGKFVLALHAGLALVLLVIYPAVLAAHRISIRHFFTKVWPVTSLGFVSRSSMGVMPMNQQVAEREMGVPRSYASFAIPLGATTKMDGCAAVYPAVAAIFVAQFYGVDLNITHYLLIIFVSVIGSAATAGTTGATVMLTLTLSTLGLPLEGVGLLLAVEPIIDMGRTAVNVTGQNLTTVIVAKREGILDEDTFNAPAAFDINETSATRVPAHVS
ncbi:sodium:proton antiporter [Corynebacterium phocae]|uniref:Sodium:proton antiporter n=1 Tax=Corynebacterium phocae TaxID=161895 RepID=A0A1L7D181_9CORY|nr:dicarboxylate/amino acid:cation symporter [Corynebacterium phocae]APT91792.1 sodium:proton antiporter [Corynebacterium phocae]KAA8728462.1 dicarboxylate/amino acid:cation symporter [Corynebacterium phocae]